MDTLTETIENTIQTAEMKMLGKIASYTRRDRMRNTEIREQLQVGSLSDQTISSTAKVSRIKFQNIKIKNEWKLKT